MSPVAADRGDRIAAAQRGTTDAALSAWYRELRRQVADDVLARLGPDPAEVRTLLYTLDGGGTVIANGTTLDVPIFYPFVITGIALLSRISGSATVDLQSSTLSTFPTSTSITGGSLPSINGYAGWDYTLAGWTKTQFNLSDTLSVVLQSVTSIQRLVVALRVRPLG